MKRDFIAKFREHRAVRIGRWILIGLTPIIAPSVATMASPEQAHAAGLAVACVILWLAQLVPAFVPTLLLLALAPMLLGDQFTATRVLGWALDPVLALFFGGMALGSAAERHGVAAALADRVVSWSGGQRRHIVTLAMLLTAVLSMWMSNTAAATLMLATLIPLTDRLRDAGLRRGVLLAVAAGANLGGLATPIGTAPNALAISSLGDSAPTFIGWMMVGLPLSAVSLAIARWWILRRCAVEGRLPEDPDAALTPPLALSKTGWLVAGIILSAVVLWLGEPIFGIPSSAVALGLAGLLFGSGLLDRDDLQRMDWGTILLIAGGIALGRMLDQTGVVTLAAEAVPWSTFPGWALATAAIGVAMVCSAVLSNTATATLILTAMTAIAPNRPELAIVLVLATSFAFPFPVSTPPNAMVAGMGIGTRDLAGLGLTMMVIAAVILSLFGPWAAVHIIR